jgi:NtrC-family two-component system sensor histidine kinase KinB
MKIKTKLRLGLGTLFLMILALSLIAASYIYALKEDTENILQDNYKTLDCSRSMFLAIDQIQTDPKAWTIFGQNLKKQQANVTEPGEREVTGKIAEHYSSLTKDAANQQLPVLIRNDLAELTRINMEAIRAKSDKALATVQSAFIWIALTGTICFLIALTLLINLPGNIGNPIRELTESIRAVAAKRYAERLHFSDKDEFGELASSFNTMAEKLEEYDNSNLSQILVEKKRIEALINNMHEPVIGLDENQKILFANDQAVKIIGIAVSDLIGKYATELARQNDLIRTLIRDKAGMNESNGKTTVPLKIYADDKESYFEKEIIDITIVPTGERLKKLIGQVILLKNITPFKELDFAKTNFIATVSHELKTPIASIKMSLQLLQSQQTGDLNEEQKQLMLSIKEDSDRLLKITGELLNMSQVETGNIQLNIQSSSPYEIMKYAVDAVKTSIEQKHMELVVQAEDKLTNVKADMEKTAWVLINFLTNAVRYSQEKGKILIQLTSTSQGIKFMVKDEGKGIDSRYRSKIFDRYFQVPGSANTGTGLGLAISKEFIEAQGGCIGVTSEIGMGSSFYFELARV